MDMVPNPSTKLPVFHEFIERVKEQKRNRCQNEACYEVDQTLGNRQKRIGQERESDSPGSMPVEDVQAYFKPFTRRMHSQDGLIPIFEI